jgi:altronate dehydratase
MKRRYIIVDKRDNVATAIVGLEKKTRVQTESGIIMINDDIPYGHKFALSTIPEGEYVYKYGEKIGRATIPIGVGEHVHVHNVEDIVDEVRKL